jgi:hypothetical protein
MNHNRRFCAAALFICGAGLSRAADVSPKATDATSITCNDLGRMQVTVPAFEKLHYAAQLLFADNAKNVTDTRYNNAGCEERASALVIIDILRAFGFFKDMAALHKTKINKMLRNALVLDVSTDFVVRAADTEKFHPKLRLDNWWHRSEAGWKIILNVGSRDKRGTLHIIVVTDGKNYRANLHIDRWKDGLLHMTREVLSPFKKKPLRVIDELRRARPHLPLQCHVMQFR